MLFRNPADVICNMLDSGVPTFEAPICHDTDKVNASICPGDSCSIPWQPWQSTPLSNPLADFSLLIEGRCKTRAPYILPLNTSPPPRDTHLGPKKKRILEATKNGKELLTPETSRMRLTRPPEAPSQAQRLWIQECLQEHVGLPQPTADFFQCNARVVRPPAPFKIAPCVPEVPLCEPCWVPIESPWRVLRLILWHGKARHLPFAVHWLDSPRRAAVAD